ncbi:winged helix-turn-helix transcriptional regulator [Streptomyces sp. NPDC019443]|uniref:winged helix-turn-helix transcriptional regulator n=1 Tax=Streptomyces sp. NPDC019443 TaxID=3365061 RepID=UPI0037A601DD
MLGQALHALERDGYVRREVHTTGRLHVEFSLTDMGRETADKLMELPVCCRGSCPRSWPRRMPSTTSQPIDLALQGGAASPLPRRSQEQTAGDLGPLAGDPAGVGKAMVNPPTTDSA